MSIIDKHLLSCSDVLELAGESETGAFLNTNPAPTAGAERQGYPELDSAGPPTATPHDEVADQPLSSLAGAMLVGAAALLVLGIQPVLLGALVDEGRMPIAALGRVATAEVIALAAGSALGPHIMMGPRIRLKTTLACMALAVVCLGVYVVHGLMALYVLRAVAGLLEGLAVGATIAIVAHTRHPDRVNGLFLAVQTIPQMLAAYLLPVTITPRWGSNAGFALLGGFALISVMGAIWLVSPAQHAERHKRGGRWCSPSVLVALTAIAIEYAGVGGAWNYIQELGNQHHFTANAIGVALSASLGFQVVGAFFVSWIGWRVSYRLALLVGVTLQTAVVVALTQTDHPIPYAMEACLFGVFWLALQSFQILQLIALDPSRRAVLLVTPLVLIGLSLGPLLCSFVVRQGDVTGAFWVAGGLLGLSSILFQAASWRRGQKRRLTPIFEGKVSDQHALAEPDGG